MLFNPEATALLFVVVIPQDAATFTNAGKINAGR